MPVPWPLRKARPEVAHVPSVRAARWRWALSRSPARAYTASVRASTSSHVTEGGTERLWPAIAVRRPGDRRAGPARRPARRPSRPAGPRARRRRTRGCRCSPWPARAARHSAPPARRSRRTPGWPGRRTRRPARRWSLICLAVSRPVSSTHPSIPVRRRYRSSERRSGPSPDDLRPHRASARRHQVAGLAQRAQQLHRSLARRQPHHRRQRARRPGRAAAGRPPTRLGSMPLGSTSTSTSRPAMRRSGTAATSLTAERTTGQRLQRARWSTSRNAGVR